MTIVFNDVVSSTEQVNALGDRTWRQLLDEHRSRIRHLIGRHGGSEMGNAGDGFLVLFESPTNALRFAEQVTSTGIHSGEVTVSNEGISGVAIHIAARVEAAADSGEVWVTGTVRDLLLGSGFEFESQGGHALKGIPGVWELHRLSPGR